MANSSMIFAFIIFNSFFLVGFAACVEPPVPTAPISKCYATKEDFVNMCNKTLTGITDGGQCFFMLCAGQTWTKAWQTCSQYGAILAQIQTTSEWNAIINYSTSVLGADLGGYEGLLFAFRDNTAPGPAGFCNNEGAFCPNSSMWFDSVTSGNQQLDAGNTWIRTHQCDDTGFDVAQPKCFVIFYYDVEGEIYGVADDACEPNAQGAATYLALCQFSTQSQNFSLTPYCLTEIPVIEIQVTDAQECAIVCSTYHWCRSFNFVINGCNNNVCQLFSWSALDIGCQYCANKVAANSTCTLYSYEP